MAEIEISILRYIPDIIAWGTGLVLAIIILRRGGGRAEKLLLSGCILMFLVQLASPVTHLLIETLMREGSYHPQIIGLINIPTIVFGLAGLVLLIIAFWIRFRRKNQEAA